jgi:DegV family protein with EDD domain
MVQVKIFADSTSDIPKELAESLDISIIPIKVLIAGENHLDGVTLQPAEFYEKLRRIEDVPTTSQPSPMDVADAYREAIRAGHREILSLHISSKLSGTYQSALLAKSMVEEEFPDARITVMDSKSVTYAFGVMVVFVARAAKEGKSVEELVALAEKVRKEQVLVALVDTLEYMQRGGRIGKVASLVGSLLNIKPIISINDEGEVYPLDKARGKNKAVSRAFEILKERIPGGPVYAAVLHAGQKDQAEEWLQKVKAMYDVKEEIITDIGPAVGTHAGPGTVGCLLIPLDRLQMA